MRPEAFPSCQDSGEVAPFDGNQLVGSGDGRFTIHDPAGEVGLDEVIIFEAESREDKESAA